MRNAILLMALIISLSCSPKKETQVNLSPEPEDNTHWSSWRGDLRNQGYRSQGISGDLRILWEWKGSSVIPFAPLVLEEKLYWLEEEGTFYSSVTWEPEIRIEKSLGHNFESPLFYQKGVFYVGSLDGLVFALNEEGETLWSSQVGRRITGSVMSLPKEENLYIGNYDGHLYALEKGSGDVAWAFKTKSYINGNPLLLGDNRLVLSGCDGHLYLLNSQDGKELESTRLGSYLIGAPAGTKGGFYLALYSGEVFGFDSTGNILWKKTFDDSFYSSPALGDQGLYIGGQSGDLYGLSYSGELLWTFTAGGELPSSPLVLGSRVYQASTDGILYVLHAQTGTLIQHIDIGTPIVGGPSFGDRTLFLTTEDGRLVALGGRDK